jgi:hypothetical protein
LRARDEDGFQAPTLRQGPFEAALAGLFEQKFADLQRNGLEQLVRRIVREMLASGGPVGEPETLPKARAARAVGLSPATIDRWQRAKRLARGDRGRVNMRELRALLAGEGGAAKEPAAVDLAAHRARRIADDLKGKGAR